MTVYARSEKYTLNLVRMVKNGPPSCLERGNVYPAQQRLFRLQYVIYGEGVCRDTLNRKL